MRRFLIIGLLLGLVLASVESHAQLNRKKIKRNNRNIAHFKGKKKGFDPAKKYNALGVSLNALNYYGDIAPLPRKMSTDISFTRPALGVSFTHRFGPMYQVTAGFAYGTLAASDAESADPEDADAAPRYIRNLSFRNRIKELSLIGQIDLFPNQGTYISRVRFTPFVFGGVAVFHHNPKAKDENGEWVALRPLGTEGQYPVVPLDETDANFGIKPYKLIQIAIPFGFGARIRLNEVLDLSGEFGFRYLFTDYIDDISRHYVNPDKLSPEARTFSYRADELANPNVSEAVALRYTSVDVNGIPYINGHGYDYINPNTGEHENNRGSSKDLDLYTMTTVRLTYILGKTFHKAKFR
jgi:hypothetical protein